MLGSPKQSGYRRSGQEHCRWVGGCIPVVELHFIKIIPSPHYNSTSLHVFTRGPTKRLKYVPGCCYSGGDVNVLVNTMVLGYERNMRFNENDYKSLATLATL